MATYYASGNLKARPAKISTAPTLDVKYLSAAQQFFAAFKALPGKLAVPRLFLAGHAVECALKALLAHSGLTARELTRKDVRHNLEKLWSEAASRALVGPRCRSGVSRLRLR
jgi:hypothetical protein